MGGFTIRAKKFISNPLLARKQCVLEVIHPSAGNVSKKDLREKLATAYKISDVNCVHVFGMKTAFGGGRSTGFALMYDNLVQAYVEQLRLAKLANLQNFAKFWWARSRLYQNENLQENMRLTAFFKL